MVFGLVFGLIFPLSAWTLSIVLSEFDFSLNSIAKIHQSSYLHYIIDMAPVVLATVFFYLGKSIESKVHLIENLGAESDWSNLLLNSTGEAIYGIDLSGNYKKHGVCSLGYICMYGSGNKIYIAANTDDEDGVVYLKDIIVKE